MARNKSGLNMTALNIEEDLREKDFANGAQLAERGNVAKGGRPKTEDKADKPMTVYFTESEKEAVKAYCGRVSFSSLVKQLLQEKGIL